MNLDVLVPLYATYSSGQKINTFNTILSGPRKENEKDGPGEMYVVLLDNGRSNVLAQKLQRRALSCIECGACQNACPVYRKIGGEAYDSTYTGPIGSVITPWMKGMEEFNHLNYLSTLCGECTDACPVMINLHDQFLYNRNDANKMKIHSFSERIVMEGWHQLLKSRKRMDWASHKSKNIILRNVYSKKWGNEKQLPLVKSKSFKQLWEERREGKN
jgi:L-lactate dehydrogenase complex protein LldF